MEVITDLTTTITLKQDMFCNPDQQLLILLLRPSITSFNTCNIKCTVPPPDALPRNRDGGVVLTGTTFNDPLLGSFILFPRTSNDIIMSSDILIQFKTAPIYSNLNIGYTATVSDNQPITIRFYSYDNILNLTMPDSLNERYWLVPDILGGKLTEYHTRTGLLTVPCILNMMVKVSSNVTSLQLRLNYVPTMRLFPCEGTLYDSNGCPAMQYTYIDPLLLLGEPLGDYARIREELISYLQETSVGLLLPLIPPRNLLLQEEQVFESRMTACLVSLPGSELGFADRYITVAPPGQEDNWTDIVDNTEARCGGNPGSSFLLGYRILSGTDGYKVVGSTITFSLSVDGPIPATSPLRIRYLQGNLTNIVHRLLCVDGQLVEDEEDDQLIGTVSPPGTTFLIANIFPQTLTDLIILIYRDHPEVGLIGEWDVHIQSVITTSSNPC